MHSCFSTLSQISLKNSFGKMVFQILVTWLFTKRKFVYWPPFWNETFFIILFADICFFFSVHTHMVQVSYRKFYGNVLKNEWVQVDLLHCAHGSEKYLRHLSVNPRPPKGQPPPPPCDFSLATFLGSRRLASAFFVIYTNASFKQKLIYIWGYHMGRGSRQSFR